MQDELRSPAPDGIEGSSPAPAAGDATPSSSAPDDRKELLDRLAAMGRERAAERQRAQALENQLYATGAQLQQQGQVLNNLQQQMTQQQWRDFNARLAEMNPVDAANERARVAMEYAQSVEARVQQRAQQQYTPSPAQQRQQESAEEYSARRAREILAEINQEHGLSGDVALKIQDLPDSAWKSETVFNAKAGALAEKRASQRGESDMAKQSSAAKLREEVRADVLKELGVSGSLSATPSPGEPEPGNSDVAGIAARHVINKSGPSKSIADLRKYRDTLVEKMGR